MARAVVCFGELLIRLNPPGRELLLQSPRLDVHVGGAEANVAISLAQFGHEARMASVVADNALGEAAVGALRRYRVAVEFVHRAPGRMGLYFLSTGAVRRRSKVLYDRAGSAFAAADQASFDWQAIFAGADWLHLSGVTPAIGAKSAEAALKAVRTARELGLAVSFDGNYRAQLWQASGGDGPAILKEILSSTTLAFVTERDLALVLGRDFAGKTEVDVRRKAYEAAFKAFPALERIAATFRAQHGVDRHEISGLIASRQIEAASKLYALDGIVDRIGAGDAFAAGVIHGIRRAKGDQYAIDFGVAAAAIKHSIPGDFTIASVADVEEAMLSEELDVRR
ncbi:MAG: sugar kinase [Parvularculaceae bacterium]